MNVQTKIMNKKKHLITSALPYINGIKHLGNLVGSMLPADVYARYLRQKGEEVLFVCGTDEHGTPAELAAANKNIDVKEFCDQMYDTQLDIYNALDLSFDHFGRTSSPQNKELTQYFANKLYDNGYVYEKSIKQFYSHTDGRFLPDRYIEGICPNCAYDNARGDQCENCTKMIDPEDLISPRSAISGDTDLELRESKHLFISLTSIAEDVRTWVDTKDDWSILVKSIAHKWLNEGLQDRCITRDLDWGIPVDRAGFEDKVYYVWFDAPIGYIAISKEWSDLDPENRNWEEYWKDTENVEYTQFMAKDNIPFHTIIFPATQLGANENWKMVDSIKGFNWLTYYGGKFSTSQKRGIFTDTALQLKPSDYWRYYLMARAPEGADSSFTWEDFQLVCNKDLCNVLGNFANRLLKFSHKKYGDTIPELGVIKETEENFFAEVQKSVDQYEAFLLKKEFRKAVHELRNIWSLGNIYITEQAPWSNPDDADTIIRVSFNFLGLIARLSHAIIPSSAQKIADIVSGDANQYWGVIKDELTSSTCKSFRMMDSVLFLKIEDEDVTEWVATYGGAAS